MFYGHHALYPHCRSMRSREELGFTAEETSVSENLRAELVSGFLQLVWGEDLDSPICLSSVQVFALRFFLTFSLT